MTTKIKKPKQNLKNKASQSAFRQSTVYIIHPDILSRGRACARDISFILEEVQGLARAINLKVISTKTLKVQKIQAGAFLGKGQRKEISLEIDDLDPDLLIFNGTLSPLQQRNLEQEWGVKVIDRTGLILEIFGERAQTKEGRLQVDLAAMQYQKSRLVRSWTHLERQRGGAGFMGGPGETQIELDRRIIGERITKLKKELEHVRRTRDLGRKSRERVPFPIIALVGYTNAGKSTLFNCLTGASVYAEDLLFATLDPTLRRLELPGGVRSILSDTVGFISDLPTHLVESFRATLEQINYADVIAHVMDVSSPDYEAQRSNVIQILSDLGIDYENDERIIELWNKIDTVSKTDLDDINRELKRSPKAIATSALTGQGKEIFLERCHDLISETRISAHFSLPVSEGKALAWLYSHCEVLERHDGAEDIRVYVMMEPKDLGKFKDLFSYAPL